MRHVVTPKRFLCEALVAGWCGLGCIGLADAQTPAGKPSPAITGKNKVNPSSGEAKSARSTGVLGAVNRSPVASLLKRLEAARDLASFREALHQLVGVLDLTRFDPASSRRGTDRRLGGQPRDSGPDALQGPWSDRDRRITDRLHAKTPKSMQVGPPSAKIDPRDLVRQDSKDGRTTTIVERSDKTGTTVTLVTKSSGETVETRTSTYDENGNLVAWHAITVQDDGSEEHIVGKVVGRDGHGHTEVSVDSFRQSRDPGFPREMHGEDQRRPLSSGLADPSPTLERRRAVGWMPLDESRGKENAAWCNPISGHCQAAGMAAGGNQINPGREQQLSSGPRLATDSKGIVVNPSPDAPVQQRRPQPIDRSQVAPPGPGGRPEPPR